jgi:hypothetical protein
MGLNLGPFKTFNTSNTNVKHVTFILIELFLFVADTLGFKSYAPAYLSPQATGKNLLIGANFASAASGYDEKAAILNVSL